MFCENARLLVIISILIISINNILKLLISFNRYDAKFLWKRIPQDMKDESDDLKHLNIILQALICNDMADFFRHVERNWPENIKTAIDDLRSK